MTDDFSLETTQFLADAKDALDKNDLLAWCRVMARDEDQLKARGVITHETPRVYHRLAVALEILGYLPGGTPQ